MFASSPPGAVDGDANEDDGVCLRAAVYYAKMAAYAEVTIKDFIDLRQVIYGAGLLIQIRCTLSYVHRVLFTFVPCLQSLFLCNPHIGRL